MTLTVFLASMTAIAIAAMLIFALTSGRGSTSSEHRAVHLRSQTHKNSRH